MPAALIGTLLRVFAGIGAGELIDKLFPGQVEKPFQSDKERMPKLVKWALVVGAGAVAFGFISKKLKLKL
jgi:hypothetical protein